MLSQAPTHTTGRRRRSVSKPLIAASDVFGDITCTGAPIPSATSRLELPALRQPQRELAKNARALDSHGSR